MTELTDEQQADLVEAAIELAFDFYPLDVAVDWEDFLLRLERYQEVDLPEDMTDPFITRIQRAVRKARREAKA